jgi:hypothetical protein
MTITRESLTAEIRAMPPHSRGKQALERLVGRETTDQLISDWVDRDFEHEMHEIFGGDKL